MKNLRLGLVGCGAIAQWHVEALQAAERTTVTACVDVLPEKAEKVAAMTGGTAGASISDALNIGVDALAILVPHHLHEQLVTEAFAAGVHVALEKPMLMRANASWPSPTNIATKFLY